MRNLILKCDLSPGDVMTMTIAVESLHAMYPGEFQTDVRTPVPDIWQNNPWVTPMNEEDSEVILLQYDDINDSNQRPRTFAEAYTRDLGDRINWPLEATVNRPRLYLSDDEKSWINQIREHFTDGRDVPYWVVNAGIKSDFTAKQWPIEHYQEVVDRTRGQIQWVQIGAKEHDHPQLEGVIDLRGKTNTRELIRLVYHAKGGLGPVTFLQHLCAAWQKPYICLLGGREPLPWVQYPLQHTLHTLGMLSCCKHGACWKSRVVRLEDKSTNNNSLCEQPILGLQKPVAKCMAMIQPAEVLQVLNRILSA